MNVPEETLFQKMEGVFFCLLAVLSFRVSPKAEFLVTDSPAEMQPQTSGDQLEGNSKLMPKAEAKAPNVSLQLQP